MFVSFFFLLRSHGLDVSLNEWMTLTEALDKGLAESSLFRFYHLCRAILVKSERDYDKFDGAFLAYFKDVQSYDSLPEELLRWLNNPDHKKPENFDEWAGADNILLSNEEIFRMFKERLAEQKDQHNGGTYWIGTHGASVFGNDGFSPKGIRVGGSSQNKSAIAVAGQRKYRDFREDKVLEVRDFQIALRSLRQFSTRLDIPKTELDIDDTIRKTGDNAGHLKLVFNKPRKNAVKLLLLMDSGGSMDPYSDLCAKLFQAVSKSSHFKDLQVYYFHNYIRSSLYLSPTMNTKTAVSTEWVLNRYDSDYKVIILGDAMMDPDELVYRYSYGDTHTPSGLEWFRAFKKRYPRIIWMIPMERMPVVGNYWGRSFTILRNEFPMYHLTMQGMEAAIKDLLVRK